MNVKELNAYSTVVFSLLFVDADGLARYIKQKTQHPLQGSGYQLDNHYYVTGNTALSSIPNNLYHLVFSGYHNTSLSTLSFANYAFNQLEKIFIENTCFKDGCIHVFFGGLPKLKSIVIGQECFQNAKSFLIEGLSSLETVNIRGGFNNVQSFRVIDCDYLKDISIGYSACSSNCQTFDLNNLNSLKYIAIKYSFSNINALNLQGMLYF